MACPYDSFRFRSGGAAACSSSSLTGKGVGERNGMESVFVTSVIDFSFFDKSVLDISLFNCVGFSNVGKSDLGIWGSS